MHERLKLIRKKLGINQASFAEKLGFCQSTLAMMEVNKRSINERHIKTICSVFGVNENWMRTGDGDMFDVTQESILDQLADEYDLSPGERAVLDTYLSLSPESRKVVMSFFRQVSENLPDETES